MPQLKILYYPDKRLREIALPVTEFNDALRKTIQEMISLLHADGAVGLAATQVGLPLRMFVMDVSREQTEPVCLINPEIIEQSEEILQDEGCMSFPGVYLKILRPRKLTVSYQNEYGETQCMTAEDLMAQCIHHETDHLNGIMFIDRLSKLKRMMAIKKFKKSTA